MKRLRQLSIGLRIALAIGLLISLGATGSTISISSAITGGGNDTFIATPTHYQDAEGSWHPINNEIVDDVMDEDAYTLSILQSTFDAGQIVEFSRNDSYVRFQPMPLQWTNDLDMIQEIVIPQEVAGIVTNTEIPPESGYYQGSVDWANAYGAGRDFTFSATRNRLKKLLTIDSTLPAPAQYIIDGGGAVLRLSFIFDPSADLDIMVDGVAWDKKAGKSTFNAIEFYKDGEYVWRFDSAMYWDSGDGEDQIGVTTLRKVGSDLWVDVLVPYSWLLTAQYPIYVDPDVTIDAAAQSFLASIADRGGIFWTSTTVGYIIYVDSSNDLVYKKTSDGGATWAAKNVLITGSVVSYDCWADWQTSGDAGTVIHIACIDTDSDDVLYVSLDTSDDSEATDIIESCQGTGAFYTSESRLNHAISITKARGGNLAVSFDYRDTDSTYFYSFYTSPDGDTWTSKTNPRELNSDHCLLFPGNEADNQDLWAAYWDASVDIMSLKTYDDSGNSWSEQTISIGMVEYEAFLQMDGAIRFSDGHLIFAAWDAYNTASADLRVWDINGAASITLKTNVLTNSDDSFLTSVFVNQANDDIYVAYAKGTTVVGLVAVFYQKSVDGGANWGGQIAMQADAEDDERWISCGAAKAAWGGKFQPIWFNDDLDDIFTNTDNGISIAAAVPEAECQAASNIGSTTARLNGIITDDKGNDCEARFRYAEGQSDDFEWGSDTDPLTDAGGGIAWTITVAGDSKAEIESEAGVPYGGTRCARLYRDGTNNVQAKVPQTAGEDYNIRFRFRKDATSASYVVHGNGAKRILLVIDSAESIKYYDEDGTLIDTGYDVTVDTWHLFEIKDIDWTAGTYDLYFEGELIVDDAEMQTNASYSNIISFINYAGTSNVYIDNVLVHKIKVLEADDFEWGSDGDPIDDSGGDITWTKSALGDCKTEIDTGEAHSGSKSLRIYRDGVSASPYCYFSQTAGQGYEIAAWVKTNAASYTGFRHGSGTKYIRVKYINADLKWYNGVAWQDTGVDIGADWVLLEVKNINWDAGTFDIHHNGEIAKSGAVMAPGAIATNQVFFLNTKPSSDGWFDDILVNDWTVYTEWQNSLNTDSTYYEDIASLDAETEYVFQTQAREIVGDLEGLWSDSLYFTTAAAGYSFGVVIG